MTYTLITKSLIGLEFLVFRDIPKKTEKMNHIKDVKDIDFAL